MPDGAEALVLADCLAVLARAEEPGLCVVVRDGQRLQQFEQALKVFAPEADVVSIPAWDCLPYDRVSPNPVIAARRMVALATLGTRDYQPNRGSCWFPSTRPFNGYRCGI